MQRLTIVADFEDDINKEAIQQATVKIDDLLDNLNGTFTEGRFLKRASLERLKEGEYTDLLD